MTCVHVRVRLGGEVYAVPVEHVAEVAELGDVTPVPGSPAPVLGVRNLHGRILPVVDLAGLLGLVRDARPSHLVVAEDGARGAGLAVDDVIDVGPLPAPAEEAESELLAGSVLVEGALVGVIDVGRVFDSLEARGPV